MTNAGKPLVSVIIPAYNAANLITETLDSIVKQTYKNIEIIVVDDGSKDQTKEVVEAFGHTVKYIYQNNSGGCSAPRNNGYTHAKGEFVHFFDADDLMLPSNIEEKVNYLLKYPSVGFVCSDFTNFKSINNEKQLEKSHFSTCPIISAKLANLSASEYLNLKGTEARTIMLHESFTNAGAVMFTRSVFEKVGKFDEALTSSEDFDINYRTLLSYDCGIIKSIGFYRRLHDSNMTANPVKMYTNGISSAEKLIGLEAVPENRRLLHQRIIVRLIGLARYYRDKNTRQSLSYSFKTLRHAQGLNRKAASQIAKNIVAAILRRSS